MKCDDSGENGGVAILIKNEIPSFITPARNNSFENIRIKLNDGTRIFSTYSLDKLRNYCLSCSFTNNKTIVMSDFNAKTTFWRGRYNDPNDNTLKKF